MFINVFFFKFMKYLNDANVISFSQINKKFCFLDSISFY